MQFAPAEIVGARVIDMERRSDHRGYFARAWCAQEFAAQGLDARIAQVNVATNLRKGTVRGLHFQVHPHTEVKVVRCTRGAIFDVIVDLRPTSSTFMRYFAAVLTAENRRALYVPEGCATGYQTLEDDTDIEYSASVPFAPANAFGVRYDDPAFDIQWPLPVSTISDADRSWPAFTDHNRYRFGP